MNSFQPALRSAAILVLGLGALTGCDTTDFGGSHGSTTVYYGVGYSDPWYHGDYDYNQSVIVTPPPSSSGSRPDRDPRPSQPIARPPMASPRPTPSIPSRSRPAPRAASRSGGRR